MLTDLDEQDDESGTPVADSVATITDSDGNVKEGTYSTLQSAIEAASEGDTVTLLVDTVASININKSLTLDLNEKTITSEASNRPITINSNNIINVTVSNGTIKGGKPEGTNNFALNGGGLYIYISNKDSKVFLNKLIITLNSAGNGGGIGAVGSGSLLISECEIKKNTLLNSSSGSGGGISLSTDSNNPNPLSVTIQNSKIVENDAGGGNGGGITSSYATLFVDETIIEGNKGSSTGGGICASSGTNLTVTDSFIRNNTSSLQGGGIYAVTSKGFKISNSKISNNTSNSYGGGIYLNYCNSLDKNSLKNSKIENNTASWGGGIAVENSSNVYIPTDLVVNNNIGKNYGASDIYSNKSELIIEAPAQGKLSCHHDIDGWYWDGYNGTQWIGHSESSNYYLYKYSNNIKFGSSKTVFLKAAHGLASLTVKYVYEDGSEASSTVSKQLEYGGSYSVDSPTIEGYSADKSVVSGTIEESSVEVTVTYSRNATPSPTPTSTPTPTNSPTPTYVPCPDGMQWNEDLKVCEVIPTPTPTVTPNVPVNPGNGGGNNGGDNPTQTTTPTQTPSQTTTPSATPSASSEAVVIEEEDTPLVGGRAWALINLIATLVSILLAIILLVAKHEKDNDEDEQYDENNQVHVVSSVEDDQQEEDKEPLYRKRRWKVISVIIAIASVIIFILTEDMRLPMRWVDKYTLLMVVLALVNVVTLYFGKKWHQPDEDDDTVEQK